MATMRPMKLTGLRNISGGTARLRSLAVSDGEEQADDQRGEDEQRHPQPLATELKLMDRLRASTRPSSAIGVMAAAENVCTYVRACVSFAPASCSPNSASPMSIPSCE